MPRELTCPKCSNADQDKFLAETEDAGQDPFSSRNSGRLTRLVGWRCKPCGNIVPLEPKF